MSSEEVLTCVGGGGKGRQIPPNIFSTYFFFFASELKRKLKNGARVV